MSTAAAIRQDEEHTQHWHWPREVMATDACFDRGSTFRLKWFLNDVGYFT